MRRTPIHMSGGAVLATLLLGLGVNSARAQEVGTSTTTTETPPPPALEVEPPPAAPLEPPGVVVEPAPVEETTAVETENKKGEEELIVTGSRIRRLDLVTPAPVSVLTKTELQESGLGSIGQILQNLPSQSNAINIQTNNGGDGSTRINLRGIGTERTLVLLNGRRFVPGGTGADSSVDLNSIPISIIERVEVLKDGASAVYGSDAVAGVVNIITKKDFSGVEGTTYIGSGQVGGFVYDLSVTAGHTTEKGNILFSFSLFDQNDIFAAERAFSNPDTAFDYAADANMDMIPDCDPNCDSNTEGRLGTLGSSAIPQTLIIDGGEDVGNAAWDSLVAATEDAGLYINDPVDGWRAYRNTGTRDSGEGDQYNYQPENYLLTPQNRYSLFASGSYDLFDQVAVYGEASYTNRQSDQLLAPEPFFSGQEGITVSQDSVYNPFGRDFGDVRRRFSEAGPRRFIEDLDTYRAVIGMNGGLPGGLGILSDWRWDTSFNYGRTAGTTIKEGLLVRPRLINALGPSFIDDGGVARCGANGVAIDGCVPLDLFGGEGAVTPEMLNYVTYTGTARGFSQQQVYDLGVNGPLFSLFDREIGLAIGYQFREEKGGFQPDPITESGDTTGNKSEATLGGYKVNSVYGELNIPIHFDVPVIETIELNGALSFVSIKANEGPFSPDPEAASQLTWKTGARWQLFDAVAIRGSASRSFRNPSVGELFAGQADSFLQVDDPCNFLENPDWTDAQRTNCKANGVPTRMENGVEVSAVNDLNTQKRVRVGGSPDVKPETANVFTTGVVFTPRFGKFLDGLSLTIDYWNIDVQNAIQPAGENVVLANCYSVDPSTSTGCNKIQRQANGQILNIFDTETNIGGVETGGLDIGFVYRVDTDIGNFRYTFDATWLQKYNEIQPSPFDAAGLLVEGKGVYDLGVFPDWRFNTTLVYGIAGFHIGANLRFLNGYKECEGDICRLDQDGDGQADIDDEGNPIIPLSREVASYVNADLFAGYQFAWDGGLTDVSVGINNVADALPPFIDNGFTANTDETAYDFIGRYFYARLAHTF